MPPSAKPTVFVLMPFDPNFDDVYNLGIKAGCELAGAECIRVDEQIFNEHILEKIYALIDDAALVIGEMTGQNANVFYEVGFAHGRGKRVLLLTQSAEDIPFDLKGYRHIVYEGRITKLKADVERDVRWFLANPAPPPLRHEFALAAKHILNYLDWNRYNAMSFARVREKIDASYSDEFLFDLIRNDPDKWARTTVSGKGNGIRRAKRQTF
jgi:hypothetical protein